MAHIVRLNGKNALATGAARGIGSAIATALVNEGAIVGLSDIRDDEGSVLAEKLGSTAR